MKRTFRLLLVLLILTGPGASAQDFVLPRTEVKTSTDCVEGCPLMVTLPSGLRMSRSHVTRGEFALFVRDTGYQQKGWGCRWDHPGIEQTEDHPVVCLNLEDTAAYLDWLSTRTGHAYRLPTLEEYRYAALSGEMGHYWWGQSVGKARANCTGCSSRFDARGTSPIGSFEANPFGIVDAVGNAWQWTATSIGDGGTDRYLVGGSWASPPADLRVSKAIWNNPELRFNTYSLRVVVDPE